MFIWSVLAGLGAALGWGFADFAGKKLVDRGGTYRYMLALQVFVTGFITVLSLLLRVPLRVSAEQLGYLCSGQLLLTGAWFLFFKALSLGQVSVMSALYAFYIVIPFTYQLVFQHLRLDALKWFGVSAVFVAAIAISIDSRGWRRKITRGIPEMLVCAAMTGVGFLFVNQAVSEVGWQTGYFYQQLFSLAWVMVILAFTRQLRTSIWPKKDPWFYVNCVANMLAFISLNLGMEFGYLSITGVVGEFSVAVTALLAWRFLSERLAVSQYLGIALGISGIISLSI